MKGTVLREVWDSQANGGKGRILHRGETVDIDPKSKAARFVMDESGKLLNKTPFAPGKKIVVPVSEAVSAQKDLPSKPEPEVKAETEPEKKGPGRPPNPKT